MGRSPASALRSVTWKRPELFPLTIGCLLCLTVIGFPAGLVCFGLGFPERYATASRTWAS